MTRGARVAYVGLAWAFLVGLVGQVFLIGLGLFGDPGFRVVHAEFGWMLHLAPLLVLLAAAAARAGQRHWQWALALVVTVFVVPIFAVMGADVPVVAALHPVAALAAFGVAVVVAVNSIRALRADDPRPRPAA